MIRQVNSPEEMQTLAAQLAACIEEGAIIFLSGDLGAGKTTFVRGFLRQLGYQGKVKSPTYALLEPYEFASHQVFHFDFYRIQDPDELGQMGMHEYFFPTTICLVEWPENALAALPTPDLQCDIEFAETGRLVKIKACTPRGTAILKKMG